jgi:hypothetical protein
VSKSRITLAVVTALCFATLSGTADAAADPLGDGAGKSGRDPDSLLSPRLESLNENQHMTRVQAAEETSTAPEGPGSLLKYDATHYLVDIRVGELTDAVVNELGDAGAIVTAKDGDRRLITAAVAPDRFDAVAAVDGVEYVDDILSPLVRCAPLISEGDAKLQANLLRGLHGVDGTGVKVGVLSDSYDRRAAAFTHAAGDISTGDLPGTGNPCARTTPVNVLSDTAPLPGLIDEGRGMAQLIHDLAPGAEIQFASALGGQTAFASKILALADAGAKVIVDDIGYVNEPFYQDGVISEAIEYVTATATTTSAHTRRWPTVPTPVRRSSVARFPVTATTSSSTPG